MLTSEQACEITRGNICPFSLAACVAVSHTPWIWHKVLNWANKCRKKTGSLLQGARQRKEIRWGSCTFTLQSLMFPSLSLLLSISIPYPADVSMATPCKAILPSDTGEMLNGWGELAWENLEIQLKIGKAIMEGDGGKLPRDVRPFWRSR